MKETNPVERKQNLDRLDYRLLLFASYLKGSILINIRPQSAMKSSYRHTIKVKLISAKHLCGIG